MTDAPTAPPLAYRPLPSLTRFVTGLLVFHGLSTTALAIQDLREISLMHAISGGVGPANGAIDAFYDQMSSMYWTSLAMFLVLVVGFCVWAYRANQNARALGAARIMSFTPGWTVGYFFVPVLHLWKPYQAFLEMWRASDPDLDLDDAAGGPVPSQGAGLILGWWWAWIGTGLVARISEKLYERASSAEAVITANQVGLLAHGLELVATGLVIAVMWSMTRRQEARAGRRALLPSAHVMR